MTPERWQQIKAAFQAAREGTAEERRAFLEALQREDPALHGEVDSLLAHERAQSTMESPVTHWLQDVGALGLQVGDRVGSYTITGVLGVGGMGEVYRAHDTKLARDVACKVLPAFFAQDRERLARFRREARVLASLNHPNIAAIHGLEDSGQTHALILELVEGPTLADRIRQGAIPVNEALPMACQIADALEAAHEHRIIHRDLKPANITITPDGTVKVLDFGLAKLMVADGSGSSAAATGSTGADTRDGAVMGTPAYMSPEQARGADIDRRTDIWAFGCVLFEMLTGTKAFDGEDPAGMLASVLRDEPALERLPGVTPERLRRLLVRCLTKELRQRTHDIGDVRLELQSIVDGDSEGATSRCGSPPRRTRSWSLVALGLALGSVIAGGVLLLVGDRTDEPTLTTRLNLALPQDDWVGFASGSSIDVTRDGRAVVYVGRGASGNGLFYRSFDETRPRPLPRTENAFNPVFSPDGEWVAFVVGTRLQKVSIAGGNVVPLADVDQLRGMSWSDDGTLIFGQRNGELMRLDADAGGIAERVTVRGGAAEDRGDHRLPDLLPDGRGVLFVFVPEGGTDMTILVRDFRTGDETVLFAGTSPRWVEPGFVVFARRSGLWAARFDLETLQPLGDPKLVMSAVSIFGMYSQIAVSREGTLVYAEGSNERSSFTPIEFQRDGSRRIIVGEGGDLQQPRLSPLGTHLLFSVPDESGVNAWTFDLGRETLTRLTFGGSDRWPIWSPDGSTIAFARPKGTDGTTTIQVTEADGRGDARTVYESPLLVAPLVFSPGGTQLLLSVRGENGTDLGVLDLDTGVLEMLLDGAADEDQADLSPDGRWLVYTSNESGADEVYARPYPEVTRGRSQVSNNGGSSPRWSPRGNEIFYRSGRQLMVVEVTSEDTFEAGTPAFLLEGDFPQLSERQYDVSEDGQRIYAITEFEAPDARHPQIVVVQNWLSELDGLVPIP